MEPQVLEVFGKPTEYSLNQLGSCKPSVFNDVVKVERYRVTIEKIEEPNEVLRERMIVMMAERGHIDKNSNLRAEAKRLGITL